MRKIVVSVAGICAEEKYSETFSNLKLLTVHKITLHFDSTYFNIFL